MRKGFYFSSIIFLIIIAAFAFASETKVLIANEPFILYFTLGKYYFNINDFGKALDYFQKTIEKNPNFAEAYHNLGITYHKLNKYTHAIIELNKAIKLKTDYAKAYYSLALIHYENKDYEHAIGNLLKVIELDPKNANAHFDLAVIYVDIFKDKELTGNINLEDSEYLKKALMHYLKVVELDSSFPYASSNAKIVGSVINDYEEKI